MLVVARVDEMDRGDLDEGDEVTIMFDSIPGKSYEGTVETISGLGLKTERQLF